MKRFINDFKKYYKFAIRMGKADLKSNVAESHLSWLWWILDPFFFMLVYTFVAQVVFGKSEQYFSAFIFIGYTSYKFFESGLKSSTKLVKANKAILKKVYLPKHILLLARMYVNGFTFAVAFILVLGSMVLYRVPLTWNVFYAIPLLVLLFLVTFSFSTILLHFGVFVDDLKNVMNVVLRLAFYLSGIFYSLDKRIDDGWMKTILLRCNPMAFVIDQLRNALLYGKGLDFVTYFIWFGVAILISLFGINLIYKNENGYIKVM